MKISYRLMKPKTSLDTFTKNINLNLKLNKIVLNRL